MKYFSLVLFLTISTYTFAQIKPVNQQQLLTQYIGTWYSADHLDDINKSLNPKIKMEVEPKLDGKSLQVEVFEKRDGKWISILVELISYDVTTDQIVASGQNEAGQCFVGKGRFVDVNHWEMKDINHLGELSLSVSFDFISSTEVVLHGDVANSTSDWDIKYIKSNPRDKNIGIQLVSVKDDMIQDPVGTLRQLGRMGYSYIETFVYSERKFYGYSPSEFRKMVEINGMKFSGSMTFKSLPDSKNREEVMNWWKTCIEDHLEAGVQYLTTSNNDIKNITSLAELDRYCEYYNAIGKLCKEKNIQFGFHNHKDEFTKIEGLRVYDYLIEHTDPALVAFQADVYWMRMGGAEPIEYFEKYPGRFFSWHTKDDDELGGSGNVNFKLLFEYATLAGLKYNVVEVEKYHFDPLTSVEMAFRYLYYSDIACDL